MASIDRQSLRSCMHTEHPVRKAENSQATGKRKRRPQSAGENEAQTKIKNQQTHSQSVLRKARNDPFEVLHFDLSHCTHLLWYMLFLNLHR